MRLTCPNCDAQYEVPTEVVPVEGRDVQCSNCGKTWFQDHPDHPRAKQDDFADDLSPTAPAPDDEVSPAQTTDDDTDESPQRRQLDPAVADILRQEAEVEFEARRRRQAQTLESQPDLGLETAEQPKPAPAEPPEKDTKRLSQAKDRMAKMRGEAETTAEAAAAAAALSSRRELLPDIDEINSTLRNDASPHRVDAEEREGIGAGGERKPKRGFRRGFLTILFLFAVMVLIYIFAPQISQAVPALEPTLASYVAWVDQLRVALDARIRSMVGALNTMANQTNS